MAKIVCTCGQIIYDQADFLKNKAHIISDQDYFDLFDELENQDWNEMTKRAIKYFHKIFQCDACNNIILFKNNKRFDFTPLFKDDSRNLLNSYLGNNWKGTMTASFKMDKAKYFGVQI